MNEESTFLRIDQVYNMDIGKISSKCSKPHIIVCLQILNE